MQECVARMCQVYNVLSFLSSHIRRSILPFVDQYLPLIQNKIEMAQSSASFTIVHRDRGGNPDFIYPSDGNLATCVVASINICRGMLRNTKIRSAFVSLAREFDRSQPRAWYQDPLRGYETIEDVVVDFINTILTSFPIVYVDDSITSPGYLGGTPRRVWDHHFRPRDQSILLNGWVSERQLGPLNCVIQPS